MEYAEYRGLVRSIAARYAHKCPLEFEEIEAQANLLFVEAIATYDPALSSFSTWATRCITWGLNNYCFTKRLRTAPDEIEMLDCTLDPERLVSFKERVKALSIDAQTIVTLLLGTNPMVLEIAPDATPRHIKGVLRKYMRANMGMKHEAIWGTMRELKTFAEGI